MMSITIRYTGLVGNNLILESLLVDLTLGSLKILILPVWQNKVGDCFITRMVCGPVHLRIFTFLAHSSSMRLLSEEVLGCGKVCLQATIFFTLVLTWILVIICPLLSGTILGFLWHPSFLHYILFFTLLMSLRWLT
ncbi:hypothetical protein MANES_01G140401v8 [Manihot esculenta]|uniref:Uncharacterized protein n=1 Tax=Manihot esculenta TaxID=3983 RepID=A0ACB7IEV8_MANES|nr:hypothetical protein MANES_01G140401v8 [Manihot esculenta]